MSESSDERAEREMKSRLDTLGARIEATRKGAADEHIAEQKAMSGSQETGRMMSLAFRMVSELVGGILAGVGIGWVLDRFLGTSPILLIVFSLLGTAAGFWNVIKAASPPKPPAPDAGKDGLGG